MEKGERKGEERERRGRKVSVFSRRGGCSPRLEPAAASEGARSPSASRPQPPRRPPVPTAGKDRRADNGEGAPSRATRGAEGGVCRCRCGTVPLRAGGEGPGEARPRRTARAWPSPPAAGAARDLVTAPMLSARPFPACVPPEGQRGGAAGKRVEGSAGGCRACPALPQCCRGVWDGPVAPRRKLKMSGGALAERQLGPPRLHSNNPGKSPSFPTRGSACSSSSSRTYQRVRHALFYTPFASRCGFRTGHSPSPSPAPAPRVFVWLGMAGGSAGLRSAEARRHPPHAAAAVEYRV